LGASAVGYVATAARVDRTAGQLGIPLVAWVSFATLLAEEIWRRND
jgi:tryptophan-rich sensory protein